MMRLSSSDTGDRFIFAISNLVLLMVKRWYLLGKKAPIFSSQAKEGSDSVNTPDAVGIKQIFMAHFGYLQRNKRDHLCSEHHDRCKAAKIYIKKIVVYWLSAAELFKEISLNNKPS